MRASAFPAFQESYLDPRPDRRKRACRPLFRSTLDCFIRRWRG